jgi:hypothetical protein
MNIFIPLPKEKRAIKEECRKQIFLAERQMEDIIIMESVICAICNQPIDGRFRSASRFNSGTSGVNLHPVHIDCIKDNSNLMDAFIEEKGYYDLSTLDLLLMSGIVNHLSDLEKEGKLPDIPKSNDSLLNFPSPETIGEPFYTLIEVLDGKITGNIISNFHSNEQMPYIYVSKKIALRSNEKAYGNNKLVNYVVAGINQQFLNRLLNSDRTIMVILDIQGSKATAMPMTGKEIKEAIKSDEWLDKIIKMQSK